ncbi:MAG: CsbD family protein [Actinomycetota bacterium]|nr:CsbD family protein [Actinomycetota bacterium]
MGLGDPDDKAKHAGEGLLGKAKEGVGKVTGNKDMQAEGQGDQAKADAKKAGDKVADAAKDVTGQ